MEVKSSAETSKMAPGEASFTSAFEEEAVTTGVFFVSVGFSAPGPAAACPAGVRGVKPNPIDLTGDLAAGAGELIAFASCKAAAFSGVRTRER
jgi:hypothetical protein